MQCRICWNEENNKQYKVREMMFGYKESFDYFECSKCLCLQIKEFPSEMSKYYTAEYYSYQPTTKLNKVKKDLLRLRDKYAVFNKGLIGKLLYLKYPYNALRSLSLLPISTEAHILDVGCGVGNLLHSLHQLGFKNILGVDQFNVKDIECKNSVTIQKKSINEVEGKWDVIMFHHSFEHFPDPENTLLRVYNLLRPNGNCIIRIPTVSSYAWKHYKVNWVQLDAPRHFFLHSIKSMEILAGKTGFDLYNVVYDSTALQFLGSEQYLKNIPLCDKRSYIKNPKNSVFSKKEIRAFTKRSKELNSTKQGDQAIFYLKKT